MELNKELNKEDFRKQFEDKTKEYGVVHKFDFDEAWEIGLELRRRKEFRENAVILTNQILNTEGVETGGVLSKTNPVKSTFAGGCYIREIFNPAGELIVTKVHKVEHPFFLMEGCMSILTEKGVETISAPYHGITAPGTKRFIYTHTNCVFITVHATDKTSIEEVENEVVSNDYSDFDINTFNLELIKKINI